MIGETVTYNNKGIPRCDLQKQLEVQQRILNPDYNVRGSSGAPLPQQGQGQNLLARSAAAKQIEKKLTVEQCLEIQRKILDSGGYY